MGNFNLRNASSLGIVAILLSIFWVAYGTGSAQARLGGAADTAIMCRQVQASGMPPMLAKRYVPSTHNTGLGGDTSSGSGGSGDKPAQPKNQPPRQPPKSTQTNYNEVLPDFMQPPKYLPK